MQPVEPRQLDPQPVEENIAPLKIAWYHKLGVLLFILLCFEVGVFLLVFPWMQAWDHNSIPGLSAGMRDLWDSAYFRGALSGLGLLNIFISLAEVVRLRRTRATN